MKLTDYRIKQVDNEIFLVQANVRHWFFWRKWKTMTYAKLKRTVWFNDGSFRDYYVLERHEFKTAAQAQEFIKFQVGVYYPFHQN